MHKKTNKKKIRIKKKYKQKSQDFLSYEFVKECKLENRTRDFLKHFREILRKKPEQFQSEQQHKAHESISIYIQYIYIYK